MLRRAVGSEFRRAWSLLVLDRWFTAFDVTRHRAFCSCRSPGPSAWANTRAASAIARAVQRRWPEAAIHFVLSRAAPYAAERAVPGDAVGDRRRPFIRPRSSSVLETWRPTCGLFDNAGRTAQLRGGAACGCTRRVHQRAARGSERKAFRLALDAADRRTLDCLSGIHRRQSELARAPQAEACCAGRRCAISTSYARAPTPEQRAATDVRRRLRRRARTCWSCRAVGPDIPARTMPRRNFLRPRAGWRRPALRPYSWARRRSAAAGRHGFGLMGALPQSDLAGAHARRTADRLRTAARRCCRRSPAVAPCVAVPIASDQGERIRRCVRAGVAIDAALDAAGIVERALSLLEQ